MIRRDEDAPATGPALSPVKQALLEIRGLRARLAELEGAAHEPIAVVGMGLRLPGGVHDEASLWRVLAEGRDTIGPIPPERWNVEAHLHPDPDHPGTMWTRFGGFLDDDVAGFDAPFFGIAPVEAASMDPQQRLMLELAWHALEDAGIAPDSLGGSRTGVFVGIGNSDYGRALFGDPRHIDSYAGSGGSVAVVPGRIAYVLGLQGPALAIDTACSASLAALHLAVQSLRAGESDLALVGGINLMLSPAAHIAFTKARMMARDGRCKTFDASADGYGRGEGAVMLVLQRERDAAAGGSRRLALVRGSALNQDGRSSGLTAPNGPAQEAVIRAALAQARLTPADIDLVEAHGTGTPLGDPIELQALAHALGEGHDGLRPLLVGSCKTNFGHLEAAAGLAGVAKVVASLRRRQVPAHLHFKQPNALLDWSSMPLKVPTSLMAWPGREDGAPARAGVSSFGFSGTNAHVIVEEAMLPDARPPKPTEAHGSRPAAGPLPHVLALSARDTGALRALAAAWRERLSALHAGAAAGNEGLDDTGDAVADLCFTANTGRAQLPERLALRAHDAAGLADALSSWLEGAAPPTLQAGRAATAPPRIAFLFTGQGAHHTGMAESFYRRFPAFRETLDRCAGVLDDLLGVPLTTLLFDAALAERLDDPVNAQPALFAVEAALAATWRSLGIVPAAVLGHSLGEYAAACVAGVFPLEDALRVLVQRGRLTAQLPGEGAMVSVHASEAEMRQALADHRIALEFAAFNGERQVVLSGARAEIERLTARLDAGAIRWRALRIPHAFHSAFVEPALAPLGEALAGVPFDTARCAIISNLTGTFAAPGELAEPGYWQRQMRAPVQFAKGLQRLLADGYTHVIEVGPHPVLLGLAAEDAAPADTVAWLPTMRRGDVTGTDLVESLQRLFVDGARVHWAALEGDTPRRRVAAPLMPFQRRRHWIDRPLSPTTTPDARPTDHVWRRLAATLARECERAPIGTNVSGYAARWATLERLTVAHAATVLREAGLFAQAGERHDVDSVRGRLGAKETYAHLLRRWLERLVDAGALRLVPQAGLPAFVSDHALPDPQLAACEAAVREALADNQPQLDYLLHCGRLLPAVIRGQESPLETLFPGGSFELAERIYQHSTPMRYINALAAAGLEALVSARGGAPLRVLEIGAGTGSTTAALVPVLRGLAAGAVEWWYTDVTPAFFDLARSKFADHPFMRFAELDLERDAAEQGFAAASFDVVFAANAVHAVRNLREALASIRSLLAPGGVLLLVESTEHLAWYDMTTGLIEGWQHFSDDLRTDNPLLPADTWLGALRDAGFGEAGAWPPPGNEAAALGQRVIAAWVPANADSHSRAAASGQAAPLAGNEAPRVDSLRAMSAVSARNSQASPAAQATDAAAHEALRQRLREAPPEEQLQLLRELVRDAVIAVLRLASDQAPGRHDRLMDLGMDSLMAVQLRNRFSKALGLARPLPATLMFDHPTVEALATYLRPLVPGATGSDATSPPVAAAAPAPAPPDHALGAVQTPLGAERVAQMSDAEIEMLLLERLDKTR